MSVRHVFPTGLKFGGNCLRIGVSLDQGNRDSINGLRLVVAFEWQDKVVPTVYIGSLAQVNFVNGVPMGVEYL